MKKVAKTKFSVTIDYHVVYIVLFVIDSRRVLVSVSEHIHHMVIGSLYSIIWHIHQEAFLAILILPLKCVNIYRLFHILKFVGCRGYCPYLWYKVNKVVGCVRISFLKPSAPLHVRIARVNRFVFEKANLINLRRATGLSVRTFNNSNVSVPAFVRFFEILKHVGRVHTSAASNEAALNRLSHRIIRQSFLMYL